ncbi:MAG TPA: response regulator [Saprospiraceae bacterium]|nr:response regulator [Saprospiraceae bacterium]HNT19358.1 response regulator [Saprospiraceae bacterium]
MKKILLIEDNDDIRENTAEILELAGFSVIIAKNGKEGVEKANAEKPDLIICDIMMPVLDGYGVLHMMQKSPELHQIPFIFLSAKAERTDFRKGMELGADDYITKPFTGTELLSAVERRLQKYETLKEEFAPGLDGLEQIIRLNQQNRDVVKELTADRNINKYKKKQIIYTEGNRPSRLYYILKGKVKLIKTNDDAKDLVVGLYKEGDFLGYTALFEGDVYKDTAEAIEDTELAVIPREDFEELLNRDIIVLRKFAKLLAKNVAEQEEHLISLAYNSLRKKVAEALISLSRKYKSADQQHFSIEISRENLASIAGTATESLIRTLSDFKSEKLIEIQGGKITLLNENKLEHLMN